MKLITFLLEKHRYSIIRAESGKKGIERALRENPDFVLLDIQLPEMNGFEVIYSIRKGEGEINIPVIAITNYAMSGSRL